MGKYNFKFNCNYSSGQSLAEILIAIGVGAILIGGTIGIISPILQSNLETKNVQTATSLAQQYLDNLRNISEGNWLNIYNLSKGAENKYILLAASSTQGLIVRGEEGFLDNDVVSGLVGSWKFDESDGAVAYDFSGNSNYGALINSPTRLSSSNCAVGECLSFNGTDQHIAIANAGFMDPVSGSKTWAWWSKGEGGYVMGHMNSTNYKGFIILVDTQIKMYAVDENSYFGSANPFLQINTGVSQNSWNHYVIVWDRGENFAKAYVNGVYIGQANISGFGVVNGYGEGMLGTGYNSIPSGSGHFNGSIDDIRIYDNALSVSEIGQLYQSRKFTRSFSVENVNRDLCGAGNISSEATTTCASGPGTVGVVDDPSTQKITALVSWAQGGSLSKIQYLTRSRNKVFDQSDWSGGGDQTGPITSENNKFASSTNIDYSTSTGAIRIQGL